MSRPVASRTGDGRGPRGGRGGHGGRGGRGARGSGTAHRPVPGHAAHRGAQHALREQRRADRRAAHDAFRHSVVRNRQWLEAPHVDLELLEFFSVEEVVSGEFTLARGLVGAQITAVLGQAAPPALSTPAGDMRRAWAMMSPDQRRDMISRHLECLELQDARKRSQASACLVYILLGTPAVSAECDGFPLRLEVDHAHVLAAVDELIEAGGVDALLQYYLASYEQSDFSAAGQQNLVASLALLYIMITVKQRSSEFVNHFAHLVDNGGRMTVIMKLLDSVMVCIVYPVLPVKKVLLVLRTTLRIVLGPPPQGQSSLAAATPHRRSSVGSAGSGGGSGRNRRHSGRSGSTRGSDDEHEPRHHPFRTKRRAYMLYVLLSPTMAQRVLCFVTLLVAASPVRKYKGQVQLYRELRRPKAKLPPAAQMASGTRHRDIVAMAVTEIVLALLKHFRHSQPLQYLFFAHHLSKSIRVMFDMYIDQDLKSFVNRQEPLDNPAQAEMLCNATPRAAARALAGKHRSVAAVNKFGDDSTGYESFEPRRPVITGGAGVASQHRSGARGHDGVGGGRDAAGATGGPGGATAGGGSRNFAVGNVLKVVMRRGRGALLLRRGGGPVPGGLPGAASSDDADGATASAGAGGAVSSPFPTSTGPPPADAAPASFAVAPSGCDEGVSDDGAASAGGRAGDASTAAAQGADGAAPAAVGVDPPPLALKIKSIVVTRGPPVPLPGAQAAVVSPRAASPTPLGNGAMGPASGDGGPTAQELRPVSPTPDLGSPPLHNLGTGPPSVFPPGLGASIGDGTRESEPVADAAGASSSADASGGATAGTSSTVASGASAPGMTGRGAPGATGGVATVLGVGRPRRGLMNRPRRGAGLSLLSPGTLSLTVPPMNSPPSSPADRSRSPFFGRGIPELSPAGHSVNLRRARLIVNILRILQKLTKRAPDKARLLSRSSPTPALKKCQALKVLPAAVYYSLKLLKQQLRFVGNWRPKNMSIVNTIYRYVKLDKQDDWMTKPVPSPPPHVQPPSRVNGGAANSSATRGSSPPDAPASGSLHEVLLQHYNAVVTEMAAFDSQLEAELNGTTRMGQAGPGDDSKGAGAGVAANGTAGGGGGGGAGAGAHSGGGSGGGAAGGEYGDDDDDASSVASDISSASSASSWSSTSSVGSAASASSAQGRLRDAELRLQQFDMIGWALHASREAAATTRVAEGGGTKPPGAGASASVPAHLRHVGEALATATVKWGQAAASGAASPRVASGDAGGGSANTSEAGSGEAKADTNASADATPPGDPPTVVATGDAGSGDGPSSTGAASPASSGAKVPAEPPSTTGVDGGTSKCGAGDLSAAAIAAALVRKEDAARLGVSVSLPLPFLALSAATAVARPDQPTMFAPDSPPRPRAAATSTPLSPASPLRAPFLSADVAASPRLTDIVGLGGVAAELGAAAGGIMPAPALAPEGVHMYGMLNQGGLLDDVELSEYKQWLDLEVPLGGGESWCDDVCSL